MPPQEAEIIATTIAPTNDLESAIVTTLPANNSAYTAIVRGFVQTGNNVMIGGLIVLGQNPLNVIVPAIGPSLSVSGALEDPTLELHDGNGALIAANDNWRSDQEAEIIATTIPPTNCASEKASLKSAVRAHRVFRSRNFHAN